MPIRLSVFLGYESTLAKWARNGYFDRELGFYRRLRDMGIDIRLVSYGGKRELDFPDRAAGIQILCNRFGLSPETYVRRIHQIHASQLLRSDVLMSRHNTAMVSGLRAQWAWQAPLVARMDYRWSEPGLLDNSASELDVKRIKGLERRALATATRLITTTTEIADWMIKTDASAAAKLAVIPNHVDGDIFRPIPSEKRYGLVYVGRLTKVKNLEALLRAVEQLGISIAIVGGENEYFSDLMRQFGDLDGRVHLLGRMKNEALPAIINQARAFALCSFSEGHPRALIEAMACGMPVIGTNVHGIGSLIAHEATGYLCDTDAESIARAVDAVLSNPALMEKLGANARKFALANYALDAIVQREYDVIRGIVERHPIRSASKRFAQYMLRRNPPWPQLSASGSHEDERE